MTSNPMLDRANRPLLRALAANWWLILLRGIAGVVFGHFWIFVVIPMIIANIILHLIEDKNVFTDEEQKELMRRIQHLETLLGDATVPRGEPDEAALRFRTPRGFATVSSALIALPAAPSPERRAVFRHAGWLPQPSPWRDVG